MSGIGSMQGRPGKSGLLPALRAALALCTVMTAAPAVAEEMPEESGSGARLFETLEVSIEGGILAPQGDLAEVLDASPLPGIRLTTSYYGNWSAWASMAGTRLDGPGSPVAVGWLASVAGLEYRRGPAWVPALGAGIGLYYVRSLEDGKDGGGYLFLEDGESEFGMQGSLRWTRRLGRALGLHAGIRFDLMFTSPRYSRAAALNLGASWTR